MQLPAAMNAATAVCCRRRRERLERRARLQNAPDMAVPRLQPITHREGSVTLAPAVQARPLTDHSPNRPLQEALGIVGH